MHPFVFVVNCLGRRQGRNWHLRVFVTGVIPAVGCKAINNQWGMLKGSKNGWSVTKAMTIDETHRNLIKKEKNTGEMYWNVLYRLLSS